MRIPTEQGWLEPLHTEHADELFELIHASRSRLYPWLPWLKRIHSPQDTAAFITHLIHERGPQYVIKVDQRICGGAGFYYVKTAQRRATLGYWLGTEYTGQGIMLDAIRHLCQFGFTQLHLDLIEIRCAAQNLQSRRVPERLGFLLEGTENKAEWLTDRYVDHAIYTLRREEFFAVPDAISAEIGSNASLNINFVPRLRNP